MGVQVVLEASVVEVGEGYIEYKKNDVRSRHSAGTVIWVAGIESAEVTKKAGTELPNQRRGRLETDKYLRSTAYENVYVTGDNICYTPQGESAPVPQMVENCGRAPTQWRITLFALLETAGK
jgi:NADH dehydrogenase